MYRPIKRVFDIVTALTLFIFISPIFVFAAILLRLTGDGEVFYFQERIGFKNNSFSIWKFATMVKGSAKMKGGFSTIRNDPRVTKIGKYLRITKFNEIPQLINVIKGDMSFVGPRPLIKQSFENYPEPVKAKIYDMTPGLTGIGSVVFRDEEDLMTTVHEKGLDRKDFYRTKILPVKGQLELWYRENQSLYVDLSLIFLTVMAVLRPKLKLAEMFFKDLPPTQIHFE